MSIPVVDFRAYSLTEKDVTEEQLHELAAQLKKAFVEIGFVLLMNTGISQEEVDQILDISSKFFLQPDELKKPFIRQSFPNNLNHGWVPVETEKLSPNRPADLKESFNTASFHPDIKWPTSDALKCFREIHTSFYQRCKELSMRVLRVMALSLGLDPDVFVRAHLLIGTDENATTMRSLYYPPVKTVKENQIRCSEHSDYGTITLVFQGSDGLEVLTRSGNYIPATNVPGSVLINIADLMQRWTADRFISASHRVLLPPTGDPRTRQSVAFFVHPDDEVLITCCDGSNKYPPITAGDYVAQKFNQSYD
ncbi:UPF0676 protein C1494.01 [Austrofundulus limnaeus]|uniref:UPF0676 protein C1494.01 n=1 Tax=Austrofundulus limnaeus TaxID=52670 RepID=A0A2I4BUL6_AUSLI|nr:PREDICTED: UPF0676 protein C1494.01-like [Austrofundulus limnaeus]